MMTDEQLRAKAKYLLLESYEIAKGFSQEKIQAKKQKWHGSEGRKNASPEVKTLIDLYFELLEKEKALS